MERKPYQCKDFESSLSDYLLGELPENARAEVETHLAECPSCRSERELLERTLRCLETSAAGPSRLSEPRRATVLEAARQGMPDPGQGPNRRRWRLAIAAALVGAACLGGGILAWHRVGLDRNDERLAALVSPPRTPAEAVPAGASEEVQAIIRNPAGSRSPRVERIPSTEPIPAGRETRTLSSAGESRRAAPEARPTAPASFGSPLSTAPSKLVDPSGEPEDMIAIGMSASGPDSPPVTTAPAPAAPAESGPVAVYVARYGKRASEASAGMATEASPRSDGIEITSQAERLVRDFAPDIEYVRISNTEMPLPGAVPPERGRRLAALFPAQDQTRVRDSEESKLTLAQAQTQPERLLERPRDGLEPVSSGPRPEPEVDWKARVDTILSRLDRRSGETPDMMFFRYWGTNPFVETASDPLSTFAVDCDTASYTLARSYLYQRGILPPREAIRTEEFIQYFPSGYAPPTEEGKAFAIHLEASPSPFAHEPGYQLLRVGLKGREIPRSQRKACSLVFVVDTSGSMRQEARLELVKESLRVLIGQLDEGDTIGIVAFDSTSRTVLEPVPASERERIVDAIATLQPQNNTNLASGIQRGYQMAVDHRLPDGTNRVILLSDGVANTGVTDVAGILSQVHQERRRGIYLTTVGVGMGNHNDELLEQLADRGDGQCVYVDRIEEARKVFVESFTGTLEPIARDVKIQVELSPDAVVRYRLLGYENRAIADQDFRDNTVDAGEVGAGHEVTALYELKLRDPVVTEGQTAPADFATARVRYLTVDHGEAVEYEKEIRTDAVHGSFASASSTFQLAACVAETAEVLRESYWARGGSLNKVTAIVEGLLDRPVAEGGKGLGDDEDVVELLALLKKADALVRQRDARADELALAIEAVKESTYLRTRIEDALKNRREKAGAELQNLRDENDRLRRRLEDILAH